MRVFERVCAGSDCQDASASRCDLSVFFSGTSVEGHMSAVFGKGVEPFDHAAFFISAGIAVSRHDDGHRVVVRPRRLDVGEAMFGAGQ